jgi:hypothetical protein
MKIKLKNIVDNNFVNKEKVSQLIFITKIVI